MKLKNRENLYVGNFYEFKEADNIIVIDMTNKLWTKQLCFVSKEGEILINGMTSIMRRHFVHRKCKTPVIIDKNRLRCSKCNQIIPPKSIIYISNVTGNILRNNDITIGEALLDNLDNKILLVDMEYIRRNKKADDNAEEQSTNDIKHWEN